MADTVYCEDMETTMEQPEVYRVPVVPGHKLRWYVWAWNGERSERMPHTANMRGTWGWDVECSCGWGSHTGGATRGSVERVAWTHKRFPGLTK